MANCKIVVAIPCPNEMVSNLQPSCQSIGCGLPTSSISKSILSKIPILFRNDLCFSTPIFFAILTAPTFPDFIKICSTVKSYGILSSYSLMWWFFPQLIVFFESKNSVSASINPSLIPEAIVKVLKTEPNS